MAFLDKLLNKYSFLSNLVEKSKTLSLPGFDEVPLYDVVVFFRNEIKKDVISVRAKSIAFTFFLAMFPGIIFLFSLIPYIPVDDLQNNLLNLIKALMPGDAYTFIEDTIIEVVTQPRGELLSIGLLLSLVFSTNGMISIMESFDKTTYDMFESRNILRKRWVALKLTLVLFVLLIVSMVMVVAGNFILAYLLDTFDILNIFNLMLFSTLKWVIIILLFFNTISFIYYYAPAVNKKFRFISPGSTLATFLAIIISLVFSYFVNNFGQYNKVYGSIGTVIALLIFIYLNSFALLIGFELNASIRINKDLRDEAEEEKNGE